MTTPFSSFWMAGYECSDLQNCFGNRVDLLESTQHMERLEEDYQLLKELDIATVREGVQWSHTEYKPYCYDWSRVIRIIDYATKANIQVLWDLCHFGYPSDLSPLHPHFCRRFVAFAIAFVEQYRKYKPLGPLIISPINEVNFISWLGGERAATNPYTLNYGWEVKYKLTQAYIQAIKAIKSIDTEILILTTEPLVNIVPDDFSDPETVTLASKKNQAQFQLLDMLGGRLCPELGGDPDLVDIIGCNYYHNNQWSYPSEKQLDWQHSTTVEGYKSLFELCAQTAKRYQRPIVITETSHEEPHQVAWIRLVSTACQRLIQQGIELWGLCIYPVLDRPDWDFTERWHHSGIWAIDPVSGQRKCREDYAREIKNCQIELLL